MGITRKEILIGFLLGGGIGILVLIPLTLWFLQGQDAGVAPPGKAQAQLWEAKASTLSLVEAEQRAMTRAHSWAQDAFLILVDASWRPSGDWKQTRAPQIPWSFYYYSPSENAMASVVVSESDVLWVPPVELFTVPPPMPAFPPAYGVDVAWMSFRAAGGESFLESYTTAMVNFRLQPEQQTLVWEVSAFQGNAYLEVRVDAQSGVVLFENQ